jgi:1-phosphofructokinase family hexose kinase
MILTLGTTPALQRTMTFDALHLDAVNRATRIRECASGKSINVARVAHTMSYPCKALTFFGGERGFAALRDLNKSGIPYDFVGKVVTRTCITLLDKSTGMATELVEEAEAVTPADAQALIDLLQQHLPHAKVLVLSGTLATGCGDDFYAKCLKLANAANVRTILDTRAAPLQLALPQKPLVVKPNRAELAATVNRKIESDEDLKSATRALIDLGAQWAAVTHGASDTIVSDGREFWRIETPKVDAINPIGSGDSVAAGIAMGLMDGASVPDACALGVACGAANAMTELGGHVNPDDVERLRKQVRVTKRV